MFESMRKVFGPVAVTFIIGAIALVFVFYGVYNPRTTKGMGQGALAATVNGDSISMQEYSRQYQQRADFYANMMKGKADPNLLRQLGIGRQVIEQLIEGKLLLQEASRMGMTASDEEVREKVKELPYFKDKSGSFDVKRYEAILSANHLSPASFESLMREDILRTHVSDFVKARAKVSEQEVKNEFLVSEDRRTVDYVALDPETAKKSIFIADKDIDELLKSESGLGAAKAQYERTKMAYIKQPPKTVKKSKETPKLEYLPFEDVKRKVAVDLLRDRKQDETSKYNRELATEFQNKAKTMTAAQFKTFAKSKGYELKSSSKFNRSQNYVQGLGEMPELVADAFKEPSPIAQAPKLYENGRTFAIVTGVQAFKPDLAAFAKDKDRLMQTALSQKGQAVLQQWISDLRTHAKVSVNKDIESPKEMPVPTAGGAPVEED